ncbi:hypothetical protein [uncultured Methanobrevibacter sp.]|uniref:hypothetical protein n=1 Tax=uncultured Methanobrevibacter sp. TaxID=253161 RepID=UPI0025F63E0C|nr:hypothetical protein [uncultured Methanobrevibacter sp.]
MNKLGLIFIVILVIIAGLLASTIVSPVLIIAEDSGEDASVDMAAKFTILGGFDWVYPGSSHNANGETLHNIHLISPNDPYHAAQDIISYTYHYTPHIIISVNNDAAEAIFGANIVDLIRSNDAYNGYAGNQNVPGTMSRGDAMDTAMNQNGMNVFQIPIQILLGNIRFIFV